MSIHLTAPSHRLGAAVRVERMCLQPRSGLARAVLGWSQTELGLRIGLTQRAIHKLEQGETEPRRTTISALEQVWRSERLNLKTWLMVASASASVRRPSHRSRNPNGPGASRVGKEPKARANSYQCSRSAEGLHRITPRVYWSSIEGDVELGISLERCSNRVRRTHPTVRSQDPGEPFG